MRFHRLNSVATTSVQWCQLQFVVDSRVLHAVAFIWFPMYLQKSGASMHRLRNLRGGGVHHKLPMKYEFCFLQKHTFVFLFECNFLSYSQLPLLLWWFPLRLPKYYYANCGTPLQYSGGQPEFTVPTTSFQATASVSSYSLQLLVSSYS